MAFSVPSMYGLISEEVLGFYESFPKSPGTESSLHSNYSTIPNHPLNEDDADTEVFIGVRNV